MSFRRGWTHGVLALVVLPVGAGGRDDDVGSLRGDRRRRRRRRERANFSGLLAARCIGTWLHVFMDFLNSYGVRLLMPFSERWFYGDALYIVDPLAVPRARRGRGAGAASRRGGHAGRASRRARGRRGGRRLHGADAGVERVGAERGARTGSTRAGRPADTRFMVTPVFANPFRREVIVDVGERYEKGFMWFEPLPHFRPAGYGVDINRTHAGRRAGRAARRAFAAYLRWSRFPFFVVEPIGDGARVYLNDYRYSGPSGQRRLVGGVGGGAVGQVGAQVSGRYGQEGRQRPTAQNPPLTMNACASASPL